MTKIMVDIPGERTYEVRVASDALSYIARAVQEVSDSEKIFLITDDVVKQPYAQRIANELRTIGFSVTLASVPAGEKSKSLECAHELWDSMAQAKLTRDSAVIACGGGVVGDLAGFVASTYMRGLPVIQIPTTLLSMVDSSVGGKTAINLGEGKNLVGTFWQPRFVCADIDVLITLNDREWSCGCAEIAKSAVIDSDDFFFWITENANNLANRESDIVKEAVTRSIVFKASVVSQDKAEIHGVRECLNYGHTLAHAIEKAAGYGTYSHGHAVAEGMRFAARLGAGLVGTPLELIKAQDELLDSLGLPALSFKADPRVLLEIMQNDKKVRQGHLRFVLPHDVGKWSVEVVESEIVLEYLQSWQKSLS